MKRQSTPIVTEVQVRWKRNADGIVSATTPDECARLNANETVAAHTNANSPIENDSVGAFSGRLNDTLVSYFEVTPLTFRLAGVFLGVVRVWSAVLALAFRLPIASRIA